MKVNKHMASVEKQSFRVVIFDISEKRLNLAVQGVQYAFCEPVPFDNPNLALEALSTDARALITSLPQRKSLKFGLLSQHSHALVNRSDELLIPRAIMSATN